jgi:hypothetical protein
MSVVGREKRGWILEGLQEPMMLPSNSRCPTNWISRDRSDLLVLQFSKQELRVEVKWHHEQVEEGLKWCSVA